MTSPLARNKVVTNLNRTYHLETDKEGFPLQGQVPLTTEYYTGAGGVSIVPQGKNVLFVNSTLAGGALNINLTNTQNYNNMINRCMLVYVSPAAGNNVTVDITGGAPARAFLLTGGTGDVATITPGGKAYFTFLDNGIHCAITGSSNTTIA